MDRKAPCYVYALAAPGLPRRLRIAGHTLMSLPVATPVRGGAASIVAVVERRREPPPISEASLREQHAIVVELWRRCDRLLPVRFGAMMSEGALQVRVRAAAPVLDRMLQQVGGRVQMTVRVFEEVPVTERAVIPRTSGTAYLKGLRDRAGSLSRAAMEIGRPVEAFVVEERVEPGQGALRVSLFHLIAASDEARYRAALAASGDATSGRRVTVSGPWPPFAFAPELPT